MKYLLPIILLTFFSCQEKDTCQECTETITIEINGVMQEPAVANLGVHCNEELDNIKKKDGEVVTDGAEGFQVETITKIECK